MCAARTLTALRSAVALSGEYRIDREYRPVPYDNGAARKFRIAVQEGRRTRVVCRGGGGGGGDRWVEQFCLESYVTTTYGHGNDDVTQAHEPRYYGARERSEKERTPLPKRWRLEEERGEREFHRFLEGNPLERGNHRGKTRDTLYLVFNILYIQHFVAYAS